MEHKSIKEIIDFFNSYDFDGNIKKWRRRKQRQGHYWTLSKIVFSAAKVLRPDSYLEIGVCEGDSLVSLLKGHLETRKIHLIDDFGGKYGGTGRGNDLHIRKILDLPKFNRLNSAMIWSEKSKDVLPVLIEKDHRFDLITVDGDHSENGAREDLHSCWELLNPGGFIIFDDTEHPNHRYLKRVFQDFAKTRGEYETINENYGIGIVQKPYTTEPEIIKMSDQQQETQENTDVVFPGNDDKLQKIREWLDPIKVNNYLSNREKDLIASLSKEITDLQEQTIESAEKAKNDGIASIEKIAKESQESLASITKSNEEYKKTIDEQNKRIEGLEQEINKTEELNTRLNTMIDNIQKIFLGIGDNVSTVSDLSKLKK